MNEGGYIYFASNASMGGLLKIGATNNSPWERLSELQSTGVPTPFVLEACIHVTKLVQAEQQIHALLRDCRRNSNREFFQICVGDALARCIPALADVLVTVLSGLETAAPRILPQDEEQVLLLIFRQMQQQGRPEWWEIIRHFGFSTVKVKYVFGSLSKRHFIRVFSEKREPISLEFPGVRKVRVVEPEHEGLQYLLDCHLIAQTEL